MMQSVASLACRHMSAFRQQGHILVRQFSSQVVQPEDMPYLHHGSRPRFREYEKFKSPRKRASKLLDELNKEAVEKSKTSNPAMWDAGFRVGDSIEIKMVTQGGVKAKDGDSKSQDIEKIRGVVLGIVNRGLNSSVIMRDVVYGLPIERKIPMHSPMVKEAAVLERNFIFKGKKRVKRSKLYYFRNLNPLRKYFSCYFEVRATCDDQVTQSSSPYSSEQGFQVLEKLQNTPWSSRTYRNNVQLIRNGSLLFFILTSIYTATVVLVFLDMVAEVNSTDCCW